MLQPDFCIFPELNTTRLLLRKVTYEDSPGIFKLRSDEQVMRYIGKERASSLADAAAFINRIVQSLNINDGITWAITLKEDPANLIGTIGFWKLIKEHDRAEIGYMLHPAYWNKGIMKEALLTVIDAGFNLLKLHSMEAQINPDNAASAALLTGTGFVKEGHFKENFYFDGTYSDTAVYSRLR